MAEKEGKKKSSSKQLLYDTIWMVVVVQKKFSIFMGLSIANKTSDNIHNTQYSYAHRNKYTKRTQP